MTVHPFLVSEEHVEVLERLRVLAERLLDVARSLAPDGPEPGEIEAVLAHLDETFLVVIVGEVKSGKSTLVNTLLRAAVCAVGPTPVTDRINILRHGEVAGIRQIDEGLAEQTVDSDRLVGLSIVDTPGTNSIIRRHEAITRGFLPRADLVLFVTSCDRPYTESENAFLHLIFDEWRRKIVFILAKTDIKEPGEVQEILEYVETCCREHLGFAPTVLPVSAREADRALAENDSAALLASGLLRLEEFVLERLDESEKTRLRLNGLADACRAVLDRLRGTLARSRGVLEADHAALKDIEAQAEWKRQDLKGGRRRTVAELDAIFGPLDARGTRFLEQRFSLRGILGRVRRRRLRERFREEVVGDLHRRVVGLLEDTVRWLSEETIRFTHYAMELFAFKIEPERRRQPAEGRSLSSFEADRREALDRVRSRAGEILEGFAPERRRREILRDASKGLGLSAAGLGAGVFSATAASLFASAWWSVIALPFLAAAWVALGVTKSRSLRTWSRRVSTLGERFRATLSEEIERGIDRSMDGIRQICDPYKSFYDAEVDRNASQGALLDEIEQEILGIREGIARVTVE